MRCGRPTLEILSQGVMAGLLSRLRSGAAWPGRLGCAARQQRE
jgi:hypothetical protein